MNPIVQTLPLVISMPMSGFMAHHPLLAQIIPLMIALPLGAAFLTALAGPGCRRLPEMICGVATFALTLLSFWAVSAARVEGFIDYPMGGWRQPAGVHLVLDGLSAFMLVPVNGIAFLVALYSIDYMRRFTSSWQFHCLLLLMIAGMNGVILTGDVFNLFVFLEVAAVASYGLVAFGVGRHELEAAFKYGVMGTLGSLCVLLAIALLYGAASTLNMADMAIYLAEYPAPHLTLLAATLFILGFGMKAALVPFHAWIPDAHPSAPAPISAMLSGVLIKALGIYALVRVLFNVLGLTPALSEVLMCLGTLSMMVGVFLAIGQWDLKRLLAYHSISQVGYVVLAIGLGTPLGLLAGLFHLFNHSVFKALLFLNSGAIEYATGTRDLKQMGGLAARMPVTHLTTLSASMSIAGVPPFNGFWSKLLIILAAVQAGRYGYATWAVIGSVLTLASFLKVMRYAFNGPLPERLANIREVPFAMQFSMAVLALICLTGGLLLLPGLADQFLQPASEALGAGRVYATQLLEKIPQ